MKSKLTPPGASVHRLAILLVLRRSGLTHVPDPRRLESRFEVPNPSGRSTRHVIVRWNDYGAFLATPYVRKNIETPLLILVPDLQFQTMLADAKRLVELSAEFGLDPDSIWNLLWLQECGRTPAVDGPVAG